MVVHSRPSTVEDCQLPMTYMCMIDQTNGPQSMTIKIKVPMEGEKSPELS